MINPIKDNLPFNIYDFFGYFFPGVFFTACILWILNIANFHITENIYNVCNHIYSQSPFLYGFILIICLIAILYIIGHLIATFSHITIDRLIVLGILDYPINRLTNTKHGYKKRHITNKYILLVFILAIWTPIYTTSDNFNTTLLILSALLLFLFMLKIINLIILNNHTKEKNNTYRENINKCFLWKIYILPSDYIIDNIIYTIETILQTNKPIDNAVIEQFRNHIDTKFSNKLDSYSSEYYWYPFFSIRELTSNNASLIYNWLYLYSFARNLSAASFLISIILIIMEFKNQTEHLQGFNTYLTTFNIIGFIFLTRYWMLYYTYYSKSIIRIFVASKLNNELNNDQNLS